MRTPGPWEIKHDFNIFGPHERLVAACGGRQSNIKGENAHEENIANAAFIVRACNAHDRLVEALEAANAFVHDSTPLHIKTMIANALAAAKEEG